MQNSTDTNAVRAGRGMFSGDFNLDIALISVKTGMTLKSGLGGQPTKVIENGSLPFENLGKLVSYIRLLHRVRKRGTNSWP